MALSEGGEPEARVCIESAPAPRIPDEVTPEVILPVLQIDEVFHGWARG